MLIADIDSRITSSWAGLADDDHDEQMIISLCSLDMRTLVALLIRESNDPAAAGNDHHFDLGFLISCDRKQSKAIKKEKESSSQTKWWRPKSASGKSIRAEYISSCIRNQIVCSATFILKMFCVE